jgi:hypothetical protein
MKKVLVGLFCFLVLAALCVKASPWGHANAYGGGSTYHSGDTTTRTNAYGGTATHTAGQGTTASNSYGASASHAEGSGTTTATNAYGGSATHYAGGGTVATNSYGQSAYGNAHYYGGAYGSAYHPPYSTVPYYGAYHPPVVVNSYSTGCYNCGGWAVAGAVATGIVVGAAVANANNNVAVANANAAAANANAAAANANAAAAYANYSMGEIVPVMPTGCATPIVNGITYYLCGNTWFSASYGANGIFYRVVPTP